MKKNILIVDSEINIIHSLQRCFRSEEYELESAQTLSDAEEVLDRFSPDMLIIDITIDHMHGRRFIADTKMLYPSLLVIVLTAYTDENTAIECVTDNLAKLYIPKPWDNTLLRQKVYYLFKLYDDMQHSVAIEVLADNFDLMELPRSYIKIHSMIMEDRDMEDISAEVEKDPVLSSKLLSLVNTAFFGLSISSVRKAVSYLGLDALETVLLSIKLFDTYTAEDCLSSDMTDIWEHSNQVNCLFSYLYSQLMGEKPPETYSVAGLLHDLGKIIMMNIDFEKYEYCYGGETSFGASRECERQFFGIGHEELGAFAMDWWNLPQELIETALYHHEPENRNVTDPVAIGLIHVADQLSSHIHAGTLDEFFSSELPLCSLFSVSKEKLITIVEHFLCDESEGYHG
ncbi:response regulator [Chitinivibrio alkaliphilus]|uniref:Response regulator receiver protein n=1 Tax=Chitinivibrio alkaliphilus ACht1 TaxID=1313304 RepID=U7D4J7_9BACT|nr:response regulator [Chitinivibrio alkaliphilus]ERP31434.1 response regulator receiver protein [Chitinivibrio alkaliphilus ACht1]